MARVRRPGRNTLTAMGLLALILASVAVAWVIAGGSSPAETETAYGTAKLTGRVLDGDGRPVPGATVSDSGTGRHVQAGKRGEFSISVPAGKRELSASRKGYVEDVQTIEARGPVRADFALWSTSPEPAPGPNSASGIIYWTSCKDLVSLTDAQLAHWRQLGMTGIVCQSGYLRGFGGQNNYTGDPGKPLSAADYSLQRQLTRSRVVARARKAGIDCYLGFYLSSSSGNTTPVADWFDDSGWDHKVLPEVRDIAAAAHRLGFAGLALDQEIYEPSTATWSWKYPGSDHSESQVRDEVRMRGRQLMETMLGAFPGIKLVAYDTKVPGAWESYVQQQVNGNQDAYSDGVGLDMWDGMTAVRGYGTIRWLEAIFYKSTQVDGESWDDALRYDARAVYSELSQRFSNWDYASSRLDVSPFSWIDPGSLASEAVRPPAYVAEQLAAFRRWGTGGEFGNYSFRGLNRFDYTPFEGALRSASAPGVVDSTPPTTTITSPTGAPAVVHSDHVDLAGTATDDYAVRVIRWRDGRGHSGTAKLTPDTASPDGALVDWTIDGIPLESGRNTIWLRTEDIHGLGQLVSLDVNR